MKRNNSTEWKTELKIMRRYRFEKAIKRGKVMRWEWFPRWWEWVERASKFCSVLRKLTWYVSLPIYPTITLVHTNFIKWNMFLKVRTDYTYIDHALNLQCTAVSGCTEETDLNLIWDRDKGAMKLKWTSCVLNVKTILKWEGERYRVKISIS